MEDQPRFDYRAKPVNAEGRESPFNRVLLVRDALTTVNAARPENANLASGRTMLAVQATATAIAIRDHESGCFASQRTLAVDAKLPLSGLKAALSWLRFQELLDTSVHSRRYGTLRYHLNYAEMYEWVCRFGDTEFDFGMSPQRQAFARRLAAQTMKEAA